MTHKDCAALDIPTRVVVADKNLMSAQLLTQVLTHDHKFHVSIVSTRAQLIAAGKNSDIVVLSADFAATLDESLRVMQHFNAQHPGVRIILLMDTASREAVVDAFRSGASGIFSCNQGIADFLKCVDRVSKGEIWASRSDIDYLLSALRATPGSRMIGCEDLSVLSKRELEVVRYAGEGLNNREIAERTRLSEHTVKNYLFRAFEKIGVSSRVELLFYLLRQENVFDHWRTPRTDPATDLNKSAEQGFPAAQLAVGFAHLRGIGAKKDRRSAYRWSALARKNAEEIQIESAHALEELRKSLTENEVAELERLLASSPPAAKSPKAIWESFTDDDLPDRPKLAV